MTRRQLTLIEGGAPAPGAPAPRPASELAELRSLVGQAIQGGLAQSQHISTLYARLSELDGRIERETDERVAGALDFLRRLDELESKIDAQSGLLARAINRIDKLERELRQREGVSK